MAKAPAIGIDLGTTYSCVAVHQHKKVEVIANELGNRTTPSCVAFAGEDRLIGDIAKNQAALNPENTIFDVKRLIGRGYDDSTVQKDMKHWPFKVIKDGERPKIQVKFKGETKTFYPEQISAMVLEKMKLIAEDYLGKTVQDAVVTVPAYFNDAQRSSTITAGEIARLNVLKILNEPTAAAIAYGFDKKLEDNTNILVYDFGGGTLDVSILSINKGIFEVKATAGDTHLGGEDLDTRLVTHFMERYKKKYKEDLTEKRALRRLRTSCEKAKRQLSSTKEATIEIEALDFQDSITRACFEDINMDLFERALNPLENALADAEMEKSQIDEVVLVGGSTRIPKVQQLVQEFFNGKELNKSINPDEAVAYGAAVQAAVLGGDTTGVVLREVTPLSLGVETKGDIMYVIIKRNTRIPTKRKKNVTTSCDEQTSVVIAIYEGERKLTRFNHKLGEFTLSGIPPAPEGVPQIEVTFDLDENCILKVSAIETSCGSKNSLTISYDSGRLSKGEVDRLIAEGKKYAAEDEIKRETLTARSTLESYCFKVKRDITSNFKGDTYDFGKKRIVEKCNGTLHWLELNPNATLVDMEDKRKDIERFYKTLERNDYSKYSQ